MQAERKVHPFRHPVISVQHLGRGPRAANGVDMKRQITTFRVRYTSAEGAEHVEGQLHCGCALQEGMYRWISAMQEHLIQRDARPSPWL